VVWLLGRVEPGGILRSLPDTVIWDRKLIEHVSRNRVRDIAKRFRGYKPNMLLRKILTTNDGRMSCNVRVVGIS
jgi:hypothetical protein